MKYNLEFSNGWPGRWYLLPLVALSFDDEPWSAWTFSIGWLQWGVTLFACDGDRQP